MSQFIVRIFTVYFSGNDQSDSLKIILNETAVKTFGLNDPIGKTIKLSNRAGLVPVQVIGVLEDFHFQSLHSTVNPMIIGAWNNPSGAIDYFTIKVSGEMSRVIEAASQVHEQFDNSTEMEYHFYFFHLPFE